MDFAVGTKVRFIERHTPPGVEPNAVGVIVAVEKVSSQLAWQPRVRVRFENYLSAGFGRISWCGRDARLARPGRTAPVCGCASRALRQLGPCGWRSIDVALLRLPEYSKAPPCPPPCLEVGSRPHQRSTHLHAVRSDSCWRVLHRALLLGRNRH